MTLGFDLRDYADTDDQRAKVDALAEHGSIRKAAKALGITHAPLLRTIKVLRNRASERGYSPAHDFVHPVPQTHIAKGVSTLYDADGKVRAQWVKASLDDAKRALAQQAAAEAMAEDLPRLPALSAPAGCNAELLNVYTLTDCHVGMLSWPGETGEPWDLTIAEDTLVAAFEQMIAASPAAKTGFVNQLGDFLHTDGMQPVTPTSGHILDTDGRFAKVVQVAVRVLRRVIDAALRKHEHVHVLLATGNHDLSSSVWLRVMFKALYENEPRVTVLASEFPYYAHQHGQTMVAFHHGHLSKNERLPLLFATAFAPMWGATKYRVAHTGHRHHVDEKEHNGMTVFQHTTLAARDAYAALGGWLSVRGATAVTYHRQWGEVARVTVRPEAVQPA